MRKSVEILGGGLAGLSLGIGLRRLGVEVTLWEAGNYPRHRVCGEFISGVSDATLKALGVDHLLDGAVACRSTAWFHRDAEVTRRDLPEVARGISRHFLDARMAEEFRHLGGTLREGVRRHASENEGEVLATGRQRTAGEWVGMKVHIEGLELASDLEMHLGDRCYLGLARVEEDRVNACGLFRGVPGDPRNFPEVCRERGLNALGRRIAAAAVDPASFSSVVGLSFGWQVAGSGAGRLGGAGAGEEHTGGPTMRVGDHLAVISPFTGNGMSMAFESAELALDPLVRYVEGDVSWEEACRIFSRAAGRGFRRRLNVAGWMQSLLIGGVGQRLVASVARFPQFPFPAVYRLLRP